MPYFTTIDKCDSISIHLASSLDHYNIHEEYGSSFWIPHLTLIGKWDSIPIHLASFLDHYNNVKEHGSSSWFQNNRVTVEHSWGVDGGQTLVCG